MPYAQSTMHQHCNDHTHTTLTLKLVSLLIPNALHTYPILVISNVMVRWSVTPHIPKLSDSGSESSGVGRCALKGTLKRWPCTLYINTHSTRHRDIRVQSLTYAHFNRLFMYVSKVKSKIISTGSQVILLVNQMDTHTNASNSIKSSYSFCRETSKNGEVHVYVRTCVVHTH